MNSDIDTMKNNIAVIKSLLSMSQSFNIQFSETLSARHIDGQSHTTFSKQGVEYHVDFFNYTIVSQFNETIVYDTSYKRTYFMFELINILIGASTFNQTYTYHNETQ